MEEKCLNTNHRRHHNRAGPRAKQIAGEHSAEQVAARARRNREVEHLGSEDEGAEHPHQNWLRRNQSHISAARLSHGNPNQDRSGDPQQKGDLRREEPVRDVQLGIHAQPPLAQQQLPGHPVSLSQHVAISHPVSCPRWLLHLNQQGRSPPASRRRCRRAASAGLSSGS